MSEPIRPALTPEEWAKIQIRRDLDYPYRISILHPFRDPRSYSLDEYRHALAALCLHGQPEGFTREDVDLLREVSALLAPRPHEGSFLKVGPLLMLADRIAALLPPEEP